MSRRMGVAVTFFVGFSGLSLAQQQQASGEEHVLEVQLGKGLGGSVTGPKVRFSKQYLRLAASEYSSEKADRLAKDRRFANKFADEAVYRRRLGIDLMLVALGNLDHKKPEDRVIAGFLIRALAELRADVKPEELARFLDAVDLEAFPGNVEQVDSSLDIERELTPDEEAALEWLFKQQEMTMKYPAKRLLEQQGEVSIPVLQRIVLTEAVDSLRVRLALHSLQTLQKPRTVERWLWSDPSLRKDRKRRTALIGVAGDLHKTYFAAQDER